MRFIRSGVTITALCCSTLLVAAGTGGHGPATLIGGTSAQGQNLPAPTPPGLTRIGTGRAAASYNWSGYAQSTRRKNRFTGVTATFFVTTVDTAVAGSQYSSDWVGIGGFNTADLVQAGVEEDNLRGSAVYQAWTEVLPASEDPLSLSVSPGDTVTVTVRESATNKWTMTVDDDTTDQSASRVVTYASRGRSVEAIHERPCIKSPCSSVSDLATLATTTNEAFDPGQFTSSTPGSTPVYAPLLAPAGRATLYDMVMLANNGTSHIATPSNANSGLDGFTVADGSAVPPPPSGSRG